MAETSVVNNFVSMSDAGSDAEERLAAVKLALEFKGMAREGEMLKVIERLVRPVHIDPKATRPTRLLVEAVKIERRPGV